VLVRRSSKARLGQSRQGASVCSVWCWPKREHLGMHGGAHQRWCPPTWPDNNPCSHSSVSSIFPPTRVPAPLCNATCSMRAHERSPRRRPQQRARQSPSPATAPHFARLVCARTACEACALVCMTLHLWRCALSGCRGLAQKGRSVLCSTRCARTECQCVPSSFRECAPTMHAHTSMSSTRPARLCARHS